MTRCRTCVMPDTRPDTPFIDGECSACVSYRRRADIDWVGRKRELVDLIESKRNPVAGFDCIVPSSGGKDSHWQTITLLELGFRPLVVTATTCHLTEIGRANIDNLARYATTIEVTGNRTTRAKLNRLGLELVGDISWPEHASIFTVPFRIAGQLGIPLVFYGECPQEAYGGPEGTETAKRMDGRWVTEFGGFLGLRATDLVSEQGITKQDLDHYRLPKPELMDCVEAYFLGQFLEWDSHRNALVAERSGMRLMHPSPANWWSGENLDNAQTGLHDHLMFRKYGYGRACAQVSVDIRMGRLGRDEGLQIVRERDGLFPYIYAGVPVNDVLAPLGLSIADLDPILHRFTNRALFTGEEDRRPILKELA